MEASPFRAFRSCVVAVARGVRDAKLGVHLGAEVAERVVTVAGAAGGVSEAAQFTEAIGAARSDVVDVADVLGTGRIAGAGDTVERVVACVDAAHQGAVGVEGRRSAAAFCRPECR